MLISLSYLYLCRSYTLIRHWVASDMGLLSLMARLRLLVPKCFSSGLRLQWVPGIFLFLLRQLLNGRNPLYLHYCVSPFDDWCRTWVAGRTIMIRRTSKRSKRHWTRYACQPLFALGGVSGATPAMAIFYPTQWDFFFPGKEVIPFPCGKKIPIAWARDSISWTGLFETFLMMCRSTSNLSL